MTSYLWYFSARTAVPPRTHLVKDLTPKLPTGLPRKSTRKLLEVAPRDAQSKFTARNRNPPDKKMALRRVQLRTRDRLGTQSGQRKAKKKHEYVRARGARGDRRDRGSSTGKAASDIAPAEFDFSTIPEAPHTLPSTFSSPPLSSDLLQSVHDLLGDNARPTPIQSLSLKHLFGSPPDANHRCFLLASETGSGKSLAYLLPMMHGLKSTEHQLARRTGPRALVLAPTHELSRQLASFGKALVHHARLRVQSASRANIANSGSTSKSWASAAKMANTFHHGDDMTATKGEFEVHPGASGMGHAVDVLMGTPSRMLEMARGIGWNKESDGARRKKPEVSLSDVEWVIVDEADVLFGSDFIDHTLLLLSDVAAARGKPVPVISRTNESTRTQAPTPLDYPFNFVLTSATIPVALAAHLDMHHPRMTRLVSPRLHRLPAHLTLEFAPYSSGNRNAEVLLKLKAVWRDDALAGRSRARIIIFANTRARAGEMGAYLSEHNVSNIVVTGHGKGKNPDIIGQQRTLGSNKHLAGFLKPMKNGRPPSPTPMSAGEKEPGSEEPRVLLSTSLLARGLDFDPSVSHVFVLDPHILPRNTADFIHRAGRTARAGGSGKVVVFGKGAGKVREMRWRLATLRAARRR